MTAFNQEDDLSVGGGACTTSNTVGYCTYIRTSPADGTGWGGMEGYLNTTSYSGVSGAESWSTTAEKSRLIKEWIQDGRDYSP